MGLVSFGVPDKEAEYLKELLELDVFVEGGTYQGGTAKKMSGKFSKVITIEKSDVMFAKAKEVLNNYPNVTMLKGDTREHLPSVLDSSNNILFWLDAHWSGGETYGQGDECPLIEELEIIFDSDVSSVILIDDARCFLVPPPLPHDYTSWPTLVEIIRVMPKNWELVVHEDVIYLLPGKISDAFKIFLQKAITEKYNKKVGFIQRVLEKVLKKMAV
ncbi:hypothetical protein LCGC14_1235640 [marine sediment metagenome]|uniref:Class I SAM-dependent methyltransferase n=1 Tax=marine sediment metagenome TaxID=412755 RepID=A0A0F9NPF0_9ZZZZ|nr:hypothetical protein [Methylophaga sp.]